MEISEKFGFNLPSRDGDDVVDVNILSDNFRNIDSNVVSKDDLSEEVEKNNTKFSEIYEAFENANNSFENFSNNVENRFAKVEDDIALAGSDAASANIIAVDASTKADDALSIVTEQESKVSNLNAEVLSLKSTSEDLFNSVAVYEELYIVSPIWSRSGYDNNSVLYILDDPYNNTVIDLKAGETYILSIETPKVGETATVSAAGTISGTLYYKDNQYIGEVETRIDLTTLRGINIAFTKDTPESDLLGSPSVVIGEKVLREGVIEDVYASIGDIETALDDRITAIEENKADKTVHHTALKVNPEDWIPSSANDFPYVDGKCFMGKALMKAGNGYRIKFSVQSQYLDHLTEPINVAIHFGNYVKYAEIVYDKETGTFYDDLFLYGGEDGLVDVTLAVGYPMYETDGYAAEPDYNAVFGEAEIYSMMPLDVIVEENNKNITKIGGDIELALDGIIAIQENLIGGGSV